MVFRLRAGLLALTTVMVGLFPLCLGQTSQPVTPESQTTASTGPQFSGPQLPGRISGTIIDQSGAVVSGAQVELAGAQSQNKSRKQDVQSGADGQFQFENVSPGPFQLTITAPNFATQSLPGTLHPGQTYVLPPILLAVAANVTDVEVHLSPVEVAEAQIKDEEQQRLLGVIPNFYVTYDPHPVALSAKQKFELAWKNTADPVTFLIVGGVAGAEQAENAYDGFGQGAQGYAKRYGAAYADLVTGTFIGSAILPSVLKQDPRYFYKGTGTKRSRLLYAIANAVICKGDNGRWQPNYSNMLGSLAAGAISNLYYPAQNRNGVGLTFENASIGIGATAAANILEEFVMRKLTPHASRRAETP